MKKILLATTALTLSAGMAAAEVKFSGTAGAGFGTANGSDAEVWSGIDLNVTVTTTTDGGVTITAADDFGGGQLADWNDDYAIEAQTSDLDTPLVTVSYNGMTVRFDVDAIDDLYDDDQDGDIGFAAALGAFNVAAVVDTSPAANMPQLSYSLSGAASGLTFGLVGTDADDDGDAAAKITFGTNYMGLGVEVSSDNGGGDDGDTRVNELALSYDAGDVSLSMAADDNNDWSVGFGYTAGAMTVNFTTDEAEAWETNLTYDLGGKASFRAAASNANDYLAAGIQFSF